MPAVPTDISELRASMPATHYLQCRRRLRIYQSCACAPCMQYRTSLHRYSRSKMFYKCLRETFGPAKRNLRVVSVAPTNPDLPRPHALSPIGGPKVYADFTHARSFPDLRCARCSNRLRLKHEIKSGSLLLPRFALSPLPNASVLPLVFSSRFCSLLSACLNCHSYNPFPSASIISGVQITPAPTRACPSVHNAPTTTATRTPFKSTSLIQC